ncbi:hypothetical protein VPH35_042052 [Triticum aestivum]
MDPSKTEKRMTPLPAPPFHKERPLPRAQRSPDRRYSPYPPPSKDDYSGKSSCHHTKRPILSPQKDPKVDNDTVVNITRHSKGARGAARGRRSLVGAYCTRPQQFGPNTIAEYEFDPMFKDVGLDMSVYGYLLPLLGHKVAPAADAPNSSTQVGTTTGYWQSDGCSEVPVREVAALKIAEN